MKILFISQFNFPDYQNDCTFHGFRSLFGDDCVDSNEAWYMYDDFRNFWYDRIPEKGMSYGRGFTLYGKLPKSKNIDRNDLSSKIKTHYFDKIVYGSITRCQDYIQEVIDNYKKNEIIFIDGEDDRICRKDLTKAGMYFKRELIQKEEDVFPIEFSIPKELIVKEVPKKEKDYAYNIPAWPAAGIGDLKTYIYTDEKPYFADYQNSHFGLTFKKGEKGGYCSLRHYEILMNGCIPYFPGLEDYPETIMVKYPKKIILETNQSVVREEIPYNYNEIVAELLNHTRLYLTTEKTAEYILNQ